MNADYRHPGARLTRVIVCALVLSTLCAVQASACPDCPEAREARHLVWTQGFGFNLFVTTLPFVVVAAVILAIERFGRRSS